jgi:hypothetical protein
MTTVFCLVDQGCYMLETSEGRWVIEDPNNGYSPTISRMWDIIIEHPDEPHSKPVKYMGSVKKKNDAIKMVKSLIKSDTNFQNAAPISNQFYNSDYTPKW